MGFRIPILRCFTPMVLRFGDSDQCIVLKVGLSNHPTIKYPSSTDG